MTSPAISTLNGRFHLESSRPMTARGRRLFETISRDVARRRYLSARRAHDSQDRTDAYLDRSAVDSVDWGDALARYVGH